MKTTQKNIMKTKPRTAQKSFGWARVKGKRALSKKVLPLMIAGLIAQPFAFSAMSVQAETNLIQNPSLEMEMPTPVSWRYGGYGTNTARFTYLTTGLKNDGSRAVRVDMTEYTNGDAKWYPEDILVTPGEKYVFSNLSESNIPTAIDVRYTMKETENRTANMNEAKYRYIHLGDVPIATTTPRMNQFAFTVPPDVKSLTVFHIIEGVGYLTTDKYSLIQTGEMPPQIDTILPTVAITAPATGSTVSGTSTPITIDATDNVAVTGVKLMLDGTIVGTEMTTAPYTFVWDTTTAANGTHTLTAQAGDAAGNIGTSTAVTVAIDNATTTQDTTAPTVAITSPADGAVITGENTVTVSATDNVGVVGVTLLFDGEIAGGEATSAPYAFGWNSLGVTNGTHTIAALAEDAAGNTATSTPVGITVTN